MAVDKHPSRKPSPPFKPPATSTTSGGKNKETISGQAGVPYGFRHELQVKPSHKSEMAHHFSSASRPGDEKSNDEPG